MATTKINIGGVLGGSRSISSAKTTITNVKSSYNSTRNQIDPKIMNRNNLNKRFANIYTKLGAVETKIGRINATVNSCVNQYNNTEQDVLANGKEIAETLKITGAVVSLLGIMSPAVKQFEEIGRIIKKDTVLDVTIDKAKEKMVDFIDETIDSLKAGATERTVHGGGGRILEDTEVDNNDAVVEKVQQNNDKFYSYGDTNYVSIDDFLNYAMVQDVNIGNCTAVAWCMGKSMYTREKCDPYSPTYWNPNKGAIYTGVSKVVETNQFATMYEELLNEKPVMFYAYNGNSISKYHAVTVVGVSENANIANLTAQDFLCIDPTDGQIKKVSEVGYHNYNGTVYTYA